MKKDSMFSKYLRIFILTALIVVGGYVSANYSVPQGTPTQFNTDEPILINNKAQAKAGRLIIGTSDLSSLSQYVFSSVSKLSYVQRVFTNTLTLKNGTERDGYILTAEDDDGLATWRPEPQNNSVASSKMYVNDFKMYVRRNAGLVNVAIPSEFDYCAISGMGPDFANSDKEKSQCAVNQSGTPKKWIMTGERADDPSFWCNARCFSLNKPIIVVENNNVPVPKARYYCLREDLTIPGNNQYNGDIFGCSIQSTFTPSSLDPSMQDTLTGIDNGGTNVGTFVQNSRTIFANLACGNGNWDIAPVGANVNFFTTGFKCR